MGAPASGLVPGAVPIDWIEAINCWAADQPRMLAVYVFGSRAKGTHRPDSDIDLAVVMDGETEGEQHANWIFIESESRSTRQLILPVHTDIHVALESNKTVMPAVVDHGIKVYERA